MANAHRQAHVPGGPCAEVPTPCDRVTELQGDPFPDYFSCFVVHKKTIIP